jgi:hypothetical protein
MAEGLTDEEVSKKLGLKFSDYESLKAKFIENEATIIREKSTEHTYVEFVLEQKRCINDLEELISSYDKEKNMSAHVGAVRAKSDIVDKIVKMGQDFGLIERKADSGRMIAGKALINLTNIELKQFVLGEIQAVNEMMLRFGDQDIAALDPGALHRPLPKTPVPKEPVKTSKRGRSKNYGGRRAVKGK